MNIKATIKLRNSFIFMYMYVTLIESDYSVVDGKMVVYDDGLSIDSP